jgi:TATA box-binding protein-associated factor RNA polymerase I subunit A
MLVVIYSIQNLPPKCNWSDVIFCNLDPKYWLSLPPEEKRKVYKCGKDYLTLEQIPKWTEYKAKRNLVAKSKPLYPRNEVLNSKVSLWQGDITHLEIDAIVNAANRTLLGGGGVDGCIHRAAGDSLLKECKKLDGCQTGKAKLTSGHQLPAKYVLHAVGPVGQQTKKLQSCYSNCLSLALKNDIRSLAFCCISTGIYGYPNRAAAVVALKTVRSWLDDENHSDKVDRIIFCTFLPIDVEIYEELMPRYFPDEVENEKTYSDETERQIINSSSDDEVITSTKKRRRGGESKQDELSSGSDTDVYEDAKGDLDEGEKLQTGQEPEILKTMMRTVSAPPTTTCIGNDSESTEKPASMETDGDIPPTIEPINHQDTEPTNPTQTDNEQDETGKKMGDKMEGGEQLASSTEEETTQEMSADQMSCQNLSDDVQPGDEAVSSSTADTEMGPAEEKELETAV